MVGTEKTADYKSAGTTVGRKKKRKEWWAGTIIVPGRRGVRKTKRG